MKSTFLTLSVDNDQQYYQWINWAKTTNTFYGVCVIIHGVEISYGNPIQ